MKKSTKGALAAGSAAVLLLGGAGSLAYWTSDATVNGGQLTSGSITLSDVQCDADWSYGGADTGQPSTPVTAIVPGDEVVKNCTGTLTLVGDHIAATVTIDQASLSSTNALSSALQVSTTNVSPTGSITTSGPVSFTIDVKFPYDGPVSSPTPSTDADNTTQSNTANGVQTATLNTINVVAVQTHDGAGV